MEMVAYGMCGSDAPPLVNEDCLKNDAGKISSLQKPPIVLFIFNGIYKEINATATSTWQHELHFVINILHILLAFFN